MDDDLISYSAYHEKRWLQEGKKLLEAFGPLTVSMFVAELALRLDISVLTSRRYLQKHSAMSGSLIVESGTVRLKEDKQF